MDVNKNALNIVDLMKAVDQMEKVDNTQVITTTGAGVAYPGNRVPRPMYFGGTTCTPIAPNVFNRLQEQVVRHKRNVIAPSVLKTKHDQFTKEVTEEIDGFKTNPEFNAWLKRAIEHRVKTAYKRYIYSKDFNAICDKAVNEVMKNVNK